MQNIAMTASVQPAKSPPRSAGRPRGTGAGGDSRVLRKGPLEAASVQGPPENPERWLASYPCPGQSPLCHADASANEPKLAQLQNRASRQPG